MSQGVMETVLSLLQDQQPPSRNRQLARFSGDHGLRVWRLYRLYKGLLGDLERLATADGGSVRAVPLADGLRLELADAAMAYRRVSEVPAPLGRLFAERLERLGLTGDRP